MDELVSRNTPKGVENGIVKVASAFNLIKFDITNSKGETRDIRRLVESFTLTEEIFSPVITLSATIRDTINFFEDFAISGQEIINIEIDKITDNAKVNAATPVKNIKLKLAVLEYPNYEKLATSPNIQKYGVVAISDFAYLSALKKISKSVKDAVITNIYNIFKTDLNVVIQLPSKIPTSKFDGIVTIQSPLRAIEWLRSKMFDSKGAPFFLYSRISNNIPRLSSWTEFITDTTYRKYVYRQLLQNTPNTPEAYAEAITRIVEMQSNIKLNKLDLAKAGAFASIVNVTDFGNKTWTQQVFNSDKSSSVSTSSLSTVADLKKQFGSSYIDALSFFSNGPTTKALSFTDMPNASMTNLNVNTIANPATNLNSTSGPLLSNIANAKAFSARMNSVTHDITVYGDFYLNPGRRIELEIPKAVNIDKYGESLKPGTSYTIKDERISGSYIIAVATHVFSDGYYISKLRVISDKL